MKTPSFFGSNAVGQEPYELRGTDDARIQALTTRLAAAEATLAAQAAQLALIPTGAWTAFTPTLGADSGNPALGTGASARGRYTKIGRTVIGQAEFIFGSSGVVLPGSGFYQLGLPVAQVNFSPQVNVVMGSLFLYDVSAGIFRAGTVLSDPSVSFARGSYTEGPAGLTLVSGTNPWSWSFSDKIIYDFTYEAAS